MEITFDFAKNERNIRERGLPFERVAEFGFDNATFLLDARRDYREIRRIAIGCLHFLCFMEIPDGIRVISFRKANQRESRKHGKPLTIDR